MRNSIGMEQLEGWCIAAKKQKAKANGPLVWGSRVRSSNCRGLRAVDRCGEK